MKLPKRQERPYGFYLWLNGVWQELRRLKCHPKGSTPGDLKLDEESWLNYFNQGLNPRNAVAADIKEGGEDNKI